MPRTATHPAAKQAAAAKYLAMLVDPLVPLAAAVGDAVAQEIVVHHWHIGPVIGAGRQSGPSKVVSPSTAELQARLEQIVSATLEAALSAKTDTGKALRMALIGKLVLQELGEKAAPEPASAIAPAAAAAAVTDALMSTAEAASALDVSRPYVAMLCDAGKLGDVVRTEGGHRRVRASAVELYRLSQIREHQGAESVREAGLNAGLYEHADDHYVNVARGLPAPAAKPSKVKPAHKARA
jgi:excisionase family DNA binding protein